MSDSRVCCSLAWFFGPEADKSWVNPTRDKYYYHGFRLGRRPHTVYQELRGGSWFYKTAIRTGSYPRSRIPDYCGNFMGFRLARRPR